MSERKFKTLEEFYQSEPEKEYAQRIKFDNSAVFWSFREHAMEGEEAGGFVEAVLSNDLSRSFGKADPHMRNRLGDIVTYLCNPYPSPSWGSTERVRIWREKGGLVGIHGEKNALKFAAKTKL